MSKKVLLIEADEFYIEVIGTFVRLFLQYEFASAKSAQEASQRIQEERADLVLADLDGDEKQTFAFTEKMRDDCETKGIPIIALSQNETLRDKALGAGCGAFITKPFKIRELEALIGKLLGST